MNRRPPVSGRRRALAVLGTLAVAAVAGWTAPVARAQQDSPTLQPFVPGGGRPSPSPSPSPRVRIRRAQPVLPATSPTTDPPTARAVPFGSPTPATEIENPAWMNGLPASPGRRYPKPGRDAPTDPTPAVADATPTPAPTPTPTPAKPGRIKPHNPPPTNPDGATASPSPGDGGDSDASGDIRIRPRGAGEPAGSPEDQLFDAASNFYVKKQYSQAAAEYERYLNRFPDGRQREAAFWWLAESYRLLKNPVKSRANYQQLIVSYPDGEYAGNANLRRASIDYEERNYAAALPGFQRSATLAKEDAIRLISRYYEAICLEQLGRRDDTRQVYEEILAITKDNPYRDQAHLSLAALAMSERRPNEAYKEYEALSREATRPEVQADSALKAGLLARELGQYDNADKLFTRAISLATANTTVRPEAILAQLQLYYDNNKYKALLDAYASYRATMPPAVQPDAMLLAANSQRQLGRHADARADYDEILTRFPGSPQAGEARYQRVISLYATNDAGFVREADEYLALGGDPVKVDQVRLMKADALFKNNDFNGAAQAYAALDNATSLAPKYKAEAAYRLGYCYSQARRPEQTVLAFDKFLRAYPEHPLAVKALMQRAVAFEQMHKYPSALADFNEIIDTHREAKEREMAMQHKALILGQQKDPGMVAAFRALLKDYPKTDLAAMAHYYIGQAIFDEGKDYPAALAEFVAARQTDPKEYGPRASLRVILCAYQLKQRAKLLEEITAYQKAKMQPDVPPTILLWLGQQEYEEKDFAAAETHLSAATAGTSGRANAQAMLMLARSRLVLEKWDGALDASQRYLASISPEPQERALGLLAQGEAQLGLKRFDDAQKSVDETLQLQPEGSLNAKARLLGGRLLFAQGKYAEAGKAYQAVAVLYDDGDITPQALTRAAEAFEKAGLPADVKKVNDELKMKYPNYVAAKTR